MFIIGARSLEEKTWVQLVNALLKFQTLILQIHVH